MRTAQEQFDKQAEHYNAQWNSWSAETLARLLEMAHPEATDDVLDIATGTGFTAMAFAPHVARVTGVDVSTGMLDLACKSAAEQGLTNITFVEASAESLPFGDASFDIVTCRIAAHHFRSVANFAAEAARVLKPGGRFALVDTTVPDGDMESADWQNAVEAIRDTSHVRNLSPNQWRDVVAGAGLSVVSVTSAGEGITVPLTDWLIKAGCTGDCADDVRHRFATAPERAKAAFNIFVREDGETVFTWQRVLLLATRSPAYCPGD